MCYRIRWIRFPRLRYGGSHERLQYEHQCRCPYWHWRPQVRPHLIICVVGPWLRKGPRFVIGKTLKSDDGPIRLRYLYSCIRHRTHRWGTSPQDVVPITGRVPDPNTITDTVQRASAERALGYMGLNCHGGYICRYSLHWAITQTVESRTFVQV